SYASLQERHQTLADELTVTNERLVESLAQNIQTRTFLQNVLESLTSGVITIDPNGRINTINKAGCDILRVKPAEVVGEDYRNILGSSLAAKKPLTDLLAGKKPYSLVEKQAQVAPNEFVPISVSSSCMKDSEGNIVGALEVFVDLTELRRMEDEIARVRSLAALGEVAAVVAHEVRNPLSGIAGFAALLRRELGADHANINYVDKIISGVEKLNRSVTSLLEYARELRHEPCSTDMNALLHETVDFFRVDLNARSSRSNVNLELPPAVVQCHVDRENFTGALINLLKNADESMPNGGQVKVVLDKRDDAIAICVSDQGVGVPESIKEKIFTPFFTTRDGGTGLGLALVRKVVDAHRGSIYVSNNSDKGSTFTIELPLR
ncbi:MAG: ATP-binding protein, partial [Candidatus Zixiibacteriota bacterium]